MGRALALRVRDAFAASERPAEAAPAPYVPPFVERHRVTVFGRPRGPWRKTHREAMQDAIDEGLAAYDASQRQHFLAVPTDIEVRRVPR